MDDSADTEAEIRREFGKAIELARARRGWTADEAARRAGLAPKTWQRLEDGLPVRPLTWVKVDQLFGLPAGTALRVWQARGDLSSVLTIPTSDDPRGLSHEGCEHASARLDPIIDLLPSLTMGDLDVVITSAQATQRVKAMEERQQLGLPEPHELAENLGFDEDAAPLPGEPDQPQAPIWTAFYAAQHAWCRYRDNYDRAARTWRRLVEARGTGYHETAQAEFRTALATARDSIAAVTDTVRAYLGQLEDGDLARHTRYWRAKRTLDDAQAEYRLAQVEISAALTEMCVES